MFVESFETITLVGGASFTKAALERACAIGDRLVAADGGADRALAAGRMPEAVIGDMDSISDAARDALPAGRIREVADQDTTDFDKCLEAISAPLILGLGFLGDRQDHQLAAYNSLVRFAQQRCILVGQHDIVFLAPPELRLDLEAGTVVSLFPMGAVEGQSEGLDWPIAGLRFAPDGKVGTSNRASGMVRLRMGAPKMLVILPEATLEHVAQRLGEAEARWP